MQFFIGIPFPGTGAYTGILAASILDIDFKTSFFSSYYGINSIWNNYGSISLNIFLKIGQLSCPFLLQKIKILVII